MENGEPTNTDQQTGKQTGEESQEVSDDNKSIVDVAKELRDEIRKEKEELKAEREKMEKANAEALLAGTSGGRVNPAPAPIDPIEYNKKVFAGEIPHDGRTNA